MDPQVVYRVVDQRSRFHRAQKSLRGESHFIFCLYTVLLDVPRSTYGLWNGNLDVSASVSSLVCHRSGLVDHRVQICLGKETKGIGYKMGG